MVTLTYIFKIRLYVAGNDANIVFEILLKCVEANLWNITLTMTLIYDVKVIPVIFI